MTRRRYTGLDPAHEDAEPIVLYLDDPEGPETFQEAAQAFHDSLVDLWRITGLPVAEKVADRLQEAIDTWHDWWMPMDLSGPWTASWTPEETVASYIARRLRETWEAIFSRPAPKLQGIQGMRPFQVIVDEAVPPGKYGIISTGLTPDQMARHRAEIPFPKDWPGPAIIEADEDGPRAFQDPVTGEWMEDDGEEDTWPETARLILDGDVAAMRDKIDRELGIFPEEDEGR